MSVLSYLTYRELRPMVDVYALQRDRDGAPRSITINIGQNIGESSRTLFADTCM